MKTPQEWAKVLIEHGVTHNATALVTDIQQDAREGMVDFKVMQDWQDRALAAEALLREIPST